MSINKFNLHLRVLSYSWGVICVCLCCYEWCYLANESHGRRAVHLTGCFYRHSRSDRKLNIPVSHMSLTALNTNRVMWLHQHNTQGETHEPNIAQNKNRKSSIWYVRTSGTLLSAYGNSLQTLRGNLSISSSRVKKSKKKGISRPLKGGTCRLSRNVG